MLLLPLSGKLEYIDVLSSFMTVNADLSAIFTKSLVSDPEFHNSQKAQEYFIYFLNRTCQAMPGNLDALRLLQDIAPSQQRAVWVMLLEKFILPADEVKAIDVAIREEQYKDIYPKLFAILKQNPLHIGAALELLNVDHASFGEPDAWKDSFRCPEPLLPLWESALFLHYAGRGRWQRALDYWERLPARMHDPFAMRLAADCFGMAGDAATALSLYHQLLDADPHAHLLRHRICELEKPTGLCRELLYTRKTAICLYSWNKAQYLERTLQALAKTDIGDNSIYILLNGCSDDSKDRVLAAREMFPDNDFEIIDLPINIGAPAARNWLVNLPEVRMADYVAFMDDDVRMPEDWLVRFLTVMEQDSRNAVVGAKVVFPSIGEDAPVLQYVCRTLVLPVPGALKLSMSAPLGKSRDTGIFDFTRPCMNVMGCLHLLRNSALHEVGGFDLRFSPSQVDDIDHDLCTCLKGYNVIYCGSVCCEHHQETGMGPGKSPVKVSQAGLGNIIGNDLKLVAKHSGNMGVLWEISQKLASYSPCE